MCVSRKRNMSTKCNKYGTYRGHTMANGQVITETGTHRFDVIQYALIWANKYHLICP